MAIGRSASAAAFKLGVRIMGDQAIRATRYGHDETPREAAWLARYSSQPPKPEPFDGDGVGGGDAAYAAELLIKAGRKHTYTPINARKGLTACRICGEAEDARIAFDGSVIVATGGKRVHTNPAMTKVWKHPKGEKIV